MFAAWDGVALRCCRVLDHVDELQHHHSTIDSFVFLKDARRKFLEVDVHVKVASSSAVSIRFASFRLLVVN